VIPVDLLRPECKPGRRTVLQALLAGVGAGLGLGCSGAEREHAPPRTTSPDADSPTPTRTYDVDESQTPMKLEPATETQVQSTAGSINAFSTDIYGRLASTPGNLVMSPASMAIAFAMVHAGARGDTAREIAKVFRFEGEPADVQRGFAEALARWDSSAEDLELHVANRLFGEQTTKFERDYVQLTDEVFRAKLEAVDFKRAHEAARGRINAWVAERTRDRIQDLLPAYAVRADSRLVLVNALYFKATWMEAFTEAATKAGTFKATGGAKSAKFMHRTDHFLFGKSAADGVRVLELPYHHGEYGFTIVLPDAVDGLGAVERALTADKLGRWISAASHERVALALPRFVVKPAESIRLTPILQEMGVAAAFGPAADFTGIAPANEQLVLSEALHKAFIAVDEKGTEAAAATAVGMRAGAAMPTGEPIPFEVDHPFLFLVRDTKTGAILFMGRVQDPTA